MPLTGIVLGLALSLGSAWVFATSAGDAAADPVDLAPRDRLDAEPNDEPASPATLTVHGLVIDAATKRGITRFRVIPGALMSGGVTWQPHLITAHRGGRFDFPPNARAWDETRFRVEAEGYRPGVSRIVKKSEGDVKLTFALQADPGIWAVALTPEGAPAAGAQATWTTVSREATGHGETITVSGHAERLGAQVAIADEAGRFHLPPESDAGMIMVAHRSGYAEIRPADILAAHVVKVRRWGQVEGRVVAGKKPVAGQKVWVYRIGSSRSDSAGTSWEDEAVTDANGKFACTQVVQGRLVVDRLFSQGAVKGIVNGLATFIEVREGQTTRVNLGGPGRTLVGRFEPPKDSGLRVDWSKVRVRLALSAPHIGWTSDEPIWEVYRAFADTEEGKGYFRDDLPVEADGCFRIEAVPPGDYLLSLWIAGPAVGRPSEPDVHYASGHASIVVSATLDERGDEPQSLGTIILHGQERR